MGEDRLAQMERIAEAYPKMTANSVYNKLRREKGKTGEWDKDLLWRDVTDEDVIKLCNRKAKAMNKKHLQCVATHLTSCGIV